MQPGSSGTSSPVVSKDSAAPARSSGSPRVAPVARSPSLTVSRMFSQQTVLPTASAGASPVVSHRSVMQPGSSGTSSPVVSKDSAAPARSSGSPRVAPVARSPSLTLSRSFSQQTVGASPAASPAVSHRSVMQPSPSGTSSSGVSKDSAAPTHSSGSPKIAGAVCSPTLTHSHSQPCMNTSGGPSGSLQVMGRRVSTPCIVSTRGPQACSEEDEEIRKIFAVIDTDQNGVVSRLEFVNAILGDAAVAAYMLPGIDGGSLMDDEYNYDVADEAFDAVANGRQWVTFRDFQGYVKKRNAEARMEKVSGTSKERMIFDLIDADGNGCISKLEFVRAVLQNPAAEQFLVPGGGSSQLMSNELSFDKVNAIFDAISCGRKRIDFHAFQRYFRQTSAGQVSPSSASSRQAKRIFIVAPGFGRETHPKQAQMLEQAGFQMHWCTSVPSPDSPNFPVGQYSRQIGAELDQFQPDLVACASVGGAYVADLLHSGLWRGPTLFINAHPSFRRLPQGVPVVLAHGSNDELFGTTRACLEELVATGTPNMCFLYQTANSGKLSSGHFSRVGDRHVMESLLQHDCLPRLVDAALNPDGPELHMQRTWRERLSETRSEAESWLGSTTISLRRRWSSQGGFVQNYLAEVPQGSEEFQRVVDVFKAAPREPPAYILAPQELWDARRVLRVQRIENSLQEECSARPYCASIQHSLAKQGVSFEPGTHTVWAFHGAEASAVESIISNPVAGFQPLASGTRGASLWGSGTYFARDAKYVADGGFCGEPSPADGSRRMLMCLLSVGIPCLGDPQHKGVLPFRQKPHRYNSSVDSLANPEIYVIQHPGAALPAYMITFA